MEDVKETSFTETPLQTAGESSTADVTIACIGNTGSGKSTIMNAIFKGPDFENGPFKYDSRG